MSRERTAVLVVLLFLLEWCSANQIFLKMSRVTDLNYHVSKSQHVFGVTVDNYFLLKTESLLQHSMYEPCNLCGQVRR